MMTMICPRCHTDMEFYRTSEASNSVMVQYVWRCPKCGHRILETLLIRRAGEKVVVLRW